MIVIYNEPFLVILNKKKQKTDDKNFLSMFFEVTKTCKTLIFAC